MPIGAVPCLALAIALQLAIAQPIFTPLQPSVPTTAPSSRLSRFANEVHREHWGTWWHGPLTANFPHPTNAWWCPLVSNSTYTWRVGEEQVGLAPWRVKALPSQLQAFPPQPPVATATFIYESTERFLAFSAAPALTRRVLVEGTGGDTSMGATFDWLSVNGVSDGPGSMRSTLIKGAPYMTVRYNGLTPRLVLGGAAVSSVNGVAVSADPAAAPTSVTGSVFKVSALSASRPMVYKLYFSAPVTLQALGGGVELRTAGSFTGIVRVALIENRLLPLMDFSTRPSVAAAIERLYDDNRDLYPTGASVTYGYQTTAQSPTGRERGIVRITFATASMSGARSGRLLMLSMPHHRPRLVFPAQPASTGTVIRVPSLRGELWHVLGNDWHLAYELSKAYFSPASGGVADPDRYATVVEQLLADAAGWPGIAWGARPDSTYFGGSDMAAVGRMAVIADELAASAAHRQHLSAAAQQQHRQQLEAAAASLRATLRGWLDARLVSTPGVPASLAYDTTWGGLIPYGDAASGGESNFGNRVYNDHHYHYGYYLSAAAALVRGDPTWGSTNRDLLLNLVRDYANPNKADPHFPFARMTDWWGGHSWAGGINALADGKNQESSSEAVNAYYAVSLLGGVLGDPDLARWGQLLAAMETAAAQTYWQIPSTSTVYPSPFRDTRAVGILWDTKVDYSTWFGGQATFIHGIQYLPFTPASEALLRPAWVAESLPLATAGLPALPAGSDGWRHFVVMARSLVDPAAAWTQAAGELAADSYFGPWASHPRSVVLHFVASRGPARCA